MERERYMEQSQKYEMEKSPKYDFVHFSTISECDFHIINNINRKISYKCCGGTGIAILRKNTDIKQTQKLIHIPIQGTCDICFLEDTQLFKTCSTCSQPFCKPCLEKITNKVCPYCRGKLKNNI